jgi:hypothetical protein
MAFTKPKRGKFLYERHPLMFDVNDGETEDSMHQWSCPNLHSPGMINALRALRGYEPLLDHRGDPVEPSRGRNLTAAGVTSILAYLVLDCPTTKRACEQLRIMRALHREPVG